MLKSYSSGVFLVILATFFFSAKTLTIKWLLQRGVLVNDLMVIRQIIAFPFLIIMGVISYRRSRAIVKCSDLAWIILLGVLCFHLSSFINIWSLQHLSPGLERSIIYTFPSIILIIQWFRGVAVSKKQWLGVAVAYAGILLFLKQDLNFIKSSHINDVVIGFFGIIFVSIIFAVYSIGANYFGKRCTPEIFTSISMIAGAISLISYSGVTDQLPVMDRDTDIWVALIGLALVGTILPSTLMNRGLALAGAERGAVFSMSGPAITAIMAAIFLQSPLTISHLIAIMILVSGITLSSQTSQKIKETIKNGSNS